MSQKIVVFTGAGMSAPSGIDTFRDKGGIWSRYSIEDVATPQAWHRDQAKVTQFYNRRRAQLMEVEPNGGHFCLVKLEERFEVVVVTQNVDNLHERAGSSNIIHLHGELTKVQSSVDSSLVYDVGGKAIGMGDKCGKGSQLRPYIVWFGEQTHYLEESIYHFQTADHLIVAGTSLQVYPAAGLIDYASDKASRYLVDLSDEAMPADFDFCQGSVEIALPLLIERLLSV